MCVHVHMYINVRMYNIICMVVYAHIHMYVYMANGYCTHEHGTYYYPVHSLATLNFADCAISISFIHEI